MNRENKIKTKHLKLDSHTNQMSPFNGFDIKVTAAKSFAFQNISGHVSMALMSFAMTTCQIFLSLCPRRTYTQTGFVDYNFD